MAHPKREHYVDDLLDALDGQAVVVWDNAIVDYPAVRGRADKRGDLYDPDGPRNDRWDTGKRALRAHTPGVTHWLVIQDDAIVCRDLRAGVRRIIGKIPEHPVSLYVGQDKPEKSYVARRVEAARAQRTNWMLFEGPWWGVAFMVPVGLIEPMIERGEKAQVGGYDKHMSAGLMRMMVDCYYTLPSLVDHRLEGTSLVPGRAQGERHAYDFIGEDASALDVDWTDPPPARPVWWGRLEPPVEFVSRYPMLRAHAPEGRFQFRDGRYLARTQREIEALLGIRECEPVRQQEVGA